jgi:hypothetical protein
MLFAAARWGMGKYDGLAGVLGGLRGRPGGLVTLSWAELDAAVGGLPASAREHGAWWHGDRAQVRAWRTAGFELETVRAGEWVSFREHPAGALAAPSQAAPSQTDPPRAEAVAALGALDPRAVLLVIPCSADKDRGGQPAPARTAGWSTGLLARRETLAEQAQRDERRVLPAWQRYNGYFYRAAGGAVREAAAGGRLVILSGAYGLLAGDEPTGWYRRDLYLADWPSGLLGRELASHAQRLGLTDVVVFAAATTDYAKLARRTPWQEFGVRNVLLVTRQGDNRGTQKAVPEALGHAFGVYWRGHLEQLPADIQVHRIVETPPSAPVEPTPPRPSEPPDVDAAVGYLADRANAVGAAELLATDPRLRGPGLYAWWADADAVATLRDVLGAELGPLIYAGQTGATTVLARITRRATLRSRVAGQHLRGNTRASTFALTLAVLLREPLDLRFVADRKIDPMSRARLVEWMRAHLSVCAYPVDDPGRLAALEHAVLDRLDPPLNLHQRPATPIRATLTRLRRSTTAG